jgi:Holliday junction resolvase RusA-like endonuclease
MTPIPLRRARINNQRFYDTQVKDKITFGLYLIQQHGSAPIFTKPLQIDITFYMRTGQQKAKMAKTHHDSVPDLDNLIKFALDAIVDTNTILTDDRIISIINAKKVYDSFPRTEFTITELE